MENTDDSKKRKLILDEVVATGAYGIVYKCKEEKDGKLREFVVKKPNPKRMDPSLNMTKFEIKMLEKLNDPGSTAIVKYLGCNYPGEHTYILMEWIPGGSLLQLINLRKTPIVGQQLVKYTVQIVEGVAYMHRKLIVHGDLKGGNVLLDGNDNLKLCDFGLSLFIRLRAKDGREELDKCRYLGSPPLFVAPEIRNVRGSFPNRCTDIWSIGCMLYQMLSGLPEDRVHAKCMQCAFECKALDPSTTSEAKNLLDLLLQVDPKNRPKTGEELQTSEHFLRFCG